MTNACPALILLAGDIAGSARVHGQLAEAAANQAIAQAFQRLRQAVVEAQGTILQEAGDELLASFASHQAALEAAQRIMRDTMSPATASIIRPGGIPRLSLHAAPIASATGPLAEHASSITAHDSLRILGLAQPGEILASSNFISALGDAHWQTRVRPELGGLLRDDSLIDIHSLLPAEAGTAGKPVPSASPRGRGLLVRHKGQNFMVSPQAPELTLGRDLANSVVIADGKVSRRHARIERRADGYHLVDLSTNGSFVTLGQHQEVLVRKHEIRLQGQGKICFGGSANDPSAECIEFEVL